MRVVLLVLLLVVAACSAPAESADTTTPTAPVTTTTAEPPTTTADATTTTEPECAEREGVLRDSRGFVCPPTMGLFQTQFRPVTALYKPGTYTTRVFEPGFSFRRTEVFRSYGENIFAVSVAEADCQSDECFQALTVFSAGIVTQLQAFLNQEIDWIQDLTSSPVEYWGFSGTQFDFRVDACNTSGVPCNTPLEGLGATYVPEFSQNRLVVVDVPGGPIGLDISAHQSRFDTYWTEVVEPILASIEFTDS